MFVLRLVYLVGEVDKKLSVAPDGEALRPQGHCSLKASYEAFVLRYVIGDLLALLEVELHGVVELVRSGRGEHCSSPRALECERAIEIHNLAIWRFTSRRMGSVLACFKPRGVRSFCHEVGKRGSLDDPGCAELQLECLQLDVPFSDPSSSVGAHEYPLQRVGRDDLDWVTLKLVS